MIVGGKLNVFENFRRAKPRPTQSISIGVDGATYLANDGMLATLNTRRVQLITPWYRLWWLWLVSLFVRPMSVADFFAAVSDSQQELKLLKERGAGYEAAIAKAKANGQEALTEKLVTGFRAYKKESQLLAIGMPKFVEEDDIVRFVKQSKRGLRLDWLKHFTRQIPDSVLASKLKADRREIFDNYVVLHYDPRTRATTRLPPRSATRSCSV